ncbi:unnamed protein product, partial [marine sediment metagenome]
MGDVTIRIAGTFAVLGIENRHFIGFNAHIPR